MQETNEEAIHSLSKHFDNLKRIEQSLPRLASFMFHLAQTLTNWCADKEFPTKQLEIGEVKWYGDGTIAFRVQKSLDIRPSAFVGERPFNVLARMEDDHPSLVRFIISIGNHIVAYANQGYLDPRKVRFWSLKMDGTGLVSFKIVNDGTGVAPRPVTLT